MMTDQKKITEFMVKPRYTYVGVIGSAGRGADQGFVTADNFSKMVDATLVMISEKFAQDEQICLVSGGAAFADHVAVALWNKFHAESENKNIKKLVLFLPSPWNHDAQNPQFEALNHSDGRIANFYHAQFSKSTGIQSLHDL